MTMTLAATLGRMSDGGTTRRIFLALVVAGALIAVVSYAVSIPFTRSAVFEMLTQMEASPATGLQPLIQLPSWPDARVVPPGVPLSAAWTIAAILIAGGALGLAASAGMRRRLFAAVAVAGVVVALAGWAISIPWSPGIAGAQMSGLDLRSDSMTATEFHIAPPAWPDDRVVPPWIPLSRWFALASLVVLTGLVGTALSPQLSTARGQKVLSMATPALAIFIGARAATPGPDLLSLLIALPVIAIVTLLAIALAALVLLAIARARRGRTNAAQ